MELDLLCPHCQHRNECQLHFPLENPVLCEACEKPLFDHGSEGFRIEGQLDQCPLCGAEHLYRQRDFNRALGIGLVVVGALLAPFSYGISLILLALLDWLIYRSVDEVACCYQCGTLFRAFPTIAKVEPFNLQIYDYYRNLKSN